MADWRLSCNFDLPHTLVLNPHLHTKPHTQLPTTTSIAASIGPIQISRFGEASYGAGEVQLYICSQGVDKSPQESLFKVPAVYSPHTYSDDLYNYSPHPHSTHTFNYPNPINPSLSISDFTIDKVLGTGAFGKVFHTTCSITNTYNALKVFQKDRLDAETLNTVLVESEIIQAISQSPTADFSLKLEASFHDESNFFLVSASTNFSIA